eukprot:CAMPEP_0117073508 /NCGR_PEP_ID=MMETSP0472-20121206/51766_1 /TAXON_ID=693140 ORGANISM="Tiarina fusus, Strain LIS" /NCGR_SAMPLE_ID=MMETSP0472 /ASSEMBLY_ACC=CAM_ASM_000603 /LENGTH=681 /DNA_ID=CAMNT_0004798103 /DNA_START=62 /DNA_END=2108 /DNA_ORIENTATION=-
MDMSLQSDLEHGSIAEDSFGGGVTLDTVDIDYEDDGNVHDQLPSVEEYKTNMVADGGSPNEDADEATHDLPTVEEYRATTGAAQQSKASSSGCKGTYFCLFAALFALVASAILIPVIVLKDGEGARLSLIPRQEAVVDYLIQTGISSEDKLRTPGTPQYEAALWIADHDAYRMKIPNGNSLDDQLLERYALAVFFHSTGGPEQWRYVAVDTYLRLEWCDSIPNTGNPVLLGVTDCKEVVDSSGTRKKYARDIFLYTNRLYGTIPDEIGYLRKLETLVLYSNPGLSGELVPGMLGLANLKDLELQYCSISGTIPASIGNLKALTNLGLSNNLLIETIPDSLFELSALQWLFLDDNVLKADIAKFGKLTNLFGLYAEDAGIYGEISSEMIDGWSNMYELDLSTNQIEGTLPDNLFSHPLMVVVDLHENVIGGTIPEVPSSNTRLKFLSLYDNEFTGPIPASIGNIEELVHLDLGLNQLVLPLPAELGQLTELRYLFLNNNEFDKHQMPAFLNQLTSLRELSLKKNQLTGTIPSSIADLSKLILLDLDRNEFEGSIPPEVSSLTNLGFLFLNRNKLTGTLPDSMSTMQSLAAVLIDGNNLNGTADVICANQFIDVDYFASDCGGSVGGSDVEFECDCCTVCCNDDIESCNNFAWTLNLDPIWEYGHNRVQWTVDWSQLPDDETP